MSSCRKRRASSRGDNRGLDPGGSVGVFAVLSRLGPFDTLLQCRSVPKWQLCGLQGWTVRREETWQYTCFVGPVCCFIAALLNKVSSLVTFRACRVRRDDHKPTPVLPLEGVAVMQTSGIPSRMVDRPSDSCRQSRCICAIFHPMPLWQPHRECPLTRCVSAGRMA